MDSLKTRKYLSVKEAATEYFEKLISVSTLYNLINSGQIKTIKLGHKILIPISELDNLWKLVDLQFTLLIPSLKKESQQKESLIMIKHKKGYKS